MHNVVILPISCSEILPNLENQSPHLLRLFLNHIMAIAMIAPITTTSVTSRPDSIVNPLNDYMIPWKMLSKM